MLGWGNYYKFFISEFPNFKRLLLTARQSMTRKEMAPCVAFWVDWHVGPKDVVFVMESNGIKFSKY